MKLTFEDKTFELPDKLQNKHINEIGIGKLMWLQRLVSKNTKPESEMTDSEFKEYTERMDEIYPIFNRMLEVCGLTDLPELPVIDSFKLLGNPQLQEWLKSAIGAVF